jgi:formylglycine-generating enzyme required for sulfatase activity
LNKADWTEPELQRATGLAQQFADPKQSYPSLKPTDGFDVNARQTVVDFLSEYLMIRDGNDVQAKICHEDLEDHWCDCQSKPGMRVRCGHPEQKESLPEHRVIEEAFQLCAFQVTNRLYDLFDQNHRSRFEDYEQYSPYLRGAAIYVSYFDATICSIWLHSQLCDEWIWEYAARGNFVNQDRSQPIYYWGDDDSKLADFAWVSSNSAAVEKLPTYAGVDLTSIGRHAHTVGRPSNQNLFGLYDMLGNVWERAANRYDSGVSRSLRGGSFLDPAIDARCSYRFLSIPTCADLNFGMRVARAKPENLGP